MTASPAISPSLLSLSEFAQRFFEVTSTCVSCAHNDRFFFKERVKWLEKHADLKLPVPVLGDPALIESLWLIHEAAGIVYSNDPSTKREVAGIHQLVQRLVPALEGR